MKRKELNEQAENLGIKVDGRWSNERVQEEIDKVLNDGKPNVGAKMYSPLVSGKFEICGVEITEKFTPSDALMKNENFVKRLKHAVKCGVVHELAK